METDSVMKKWDLMQESEKANTKVTSGLDKGGAKCKEWIEDSERNRKKRSG
jgi:hypothetical protein